ncbi:hypothetical protein B0H16DRAFT_1475301 [Mycena metata]|uniref:Uncharacterized protein n=1 Tax=Mycena metata TaxID=1033252 RepID=A0AAD7HFD5_9AGAR|nr:hypothetical protein B0H16DRAFT_1475301 [Mycena metata]
MGSIEASVKYDTLELVANVTVRYQRNEGTFKLIIPAHYSEGNDLVVEYSRADHNCETLDLRCRSKLQIQSLVNRVRRNLLRIQAHHHHFQRSQVKFNPNCDAKELPRASDLPVTYALELGKETMFQWRESKEVATQASREHVNVTETYKIMLSENIIVNSSHLAGETHQITLRNVDSKIVHITPLVAVRRRENRFVRQLDGPAFDMSDIQRVVNGQGGEVNGHAYQGKY